MAGRRRILFVIVSMAIGLFAPEPVFAQKASTIGVFLWHESPNDRKALGGLMRGFLALGLAADVRELNADGDEARARELLTSLERDGARLVVALGTRATQLARRHLRDVPIVFTAVTNPVLSGIVPAWEGSGTTVAGNSNWLDRREMLSAFRLAVPGMRRLGVLSSRGNAVSGAEIAEARAALGSQRGLELVHHVLGETDDLGELMSRAVADVDAIWVPIDFKLYQEESLRRIVAAADEAGIPVVSSCERCAGAGALIVVTVDYELLGLRASAIVKRVLFGGEDPGTIPVGRLRSSRIYVDLEAARKSSRELPLDLIMKAYRVFGPEPR